mgnify:CR=1 FL=1
MTILKSTTIGEYVKNEIMALRKEKNKMPDVSVSHSLRCFILRMTSLSYSTLMSMLFLFMIVPPFFRKYRIKRRIVQVNK